MGIVKKCRHGRGKRNARARLRAWRACGCTWYADLRLNGHRVYVPCGPDERHAHAEHARFVADRAAGRLTAAATAATVAECADAWIAHLEAASPPIKRGTLRNARSRAVIVRGWFGDAPAIRVTSRDIADFLDDVRAKYSAAYTAGLRVAVRAVFAHAAAQGVIPSDPAGGVKAPVRGSSNAGTGATNPNHVPLSDVERIIAAMPYGAPRDMATVALLTGLRLGELCGLTPASYDAATGTLSVRENAGQDGRGTPKTAAGYRLVALTPDAAAIAGRRAAGTDAGAPLFGLRYRQGADVLRDTLKECGLYVRGRGWHLFRHANTMLRDASGQSLRDAAAELGHGSNTAQTLSYGWTAERRTAPPIDAARTTHAKPSAATGEGTPPAP